MRRAGYILAMIFVVPLVALFAASVAFAIALLHGIQCAQEWEE